MMNSDNQALCLSMDSIDSIETHEDQRPGRMAHRFNEGFIDSDESECGASSATSGYSSEPNSEQDLGGLEETEEETEPSMVYENTKSLLHTLEYIICVREMCDVTFLVGRKKEPVYGLQAVMGARSRYFYQMFLAQKKKAEKKRQEGKGFLSLFRKRRVSGTEPQPASQAVDSENNRLTIPVPDYDDLVFRRVVSFVHFGHVTVTTDTVIGLICAATEFQLDDLRKACWDFVDRCLTSGNAKAILKASSLYKKRPHVKLFLKMISKIRD